MSIDERPIPQVNPRPGLVKALGVMNLVISTLLSTCLTLPAAWLLIAGDPVQFGIAPPSPTLTLTVGTASGPPPPGPSITVSPANSGKPPAQPRTLAGAMHSMTSKDVPVLARYGLIDLATAWALNLAMFVSGIGLVNFKRWGVRLSDGVAWAKIMRLVVLTGGFVLFVAPLLSQALAQKVVAAVVASRGIGPDVASLRTAYWMVLVVAAVVMGVLGLAYPAVMIWVARRPGFRNALVSRVPMVEARQA